MTEQEEHGGPSRKSEIVNQLRRDRGKPFIPKLSPHRQIFTLLSASPPHTKTVSIHSHSHTWSDIFLYHSFTHIPSTLQTNALLIKY